MEKNNSYPTECVNPSSECVNPSRECVSPSREFIKYTERHHEEFHMTSICEVLDVLKLLRSPHPMTKEELYVWLEGRPASDAENHIMRSRNISFKFEDGSYMGFLHWTDDLDSVLTKLTQQGACLEHLGYYDLFD